MWPFGKKNDEPAAIAGEDSTGDLPEVAADAPAAAHSGLEHGPYDGDSVAYDDVDFSDFAVGTLDLGSMKIPMPNPSEVQVEMGEDGPRMLHIVTQFGRITPVAFAAPRSGGVWAESVGDIVAGMQADGLDVTIDDGPWGKEVVGTTEHATIRIFGVDGPRWTLRMTLAAPRDRAAELADLGHEVAARTFIYRGETPMMSGAVLPVVMPAQLVAQIQQAMQEQANSEANGSASTPAPAPETQPAQPEPAQPQPAQTEPASEKPTGDAGSALQQMKQNEETK